jgi:predicted lipoprotein
MSTYLIPTDESFVEVIARSIAKNRLEQDASTSMTELLGVKIDISEKMEATLDRVFETLWAGSTENDQHQRATYRSDALAAINAINLKLITST